MSDPVTFVDDENRDLTHALATMLSGEVERGEFPGASWCVVRDGVIVSRGATGFSVLEPERIEATTETIYDLASLTKPLVTTTLALISAVEGKVSLGDPIRALIPEIPSTSDLGATTWTDLLAHRAGLEAWYPLYTGGTGRESYLRALLSRPLAYAPRSTVIYTDLGFVLLFLALERLWDCDFERLAKTRLLEPLGLDDCYVSPPGALRERVAATERGNEKEREMVASRGLSFDGWRDGIIWGQVNDGNAWHLGGVAGNAGLFGTADDVARLAGVYLEGGGLLPDSLRASSIECYAEGDGEKRGLGWQLRSSDPDHPAKPLSGRSFGHTGFTGTSVWVDPDAALIVVLLTNRIHPRVRESRIQSVRRRVNEIVAGATWWPG